MSVYDEAADIIHRTRERLGPNGERWSQGYAGNGETACLLVALVDVAGPRAGLAYKAASRAIRDNLPECYERSIPAFNDDKTNVTFEDVDLVLKRAAHDLEQIAR